MSCGVDRKCGLDPALLWLWHRPAAVTLIRSLAWESLYAAGAPLKKKNIYICVCVYIYIYKIKEAVWGFFNYPCLYGWTLLTETGLSIIPGPILFVCFQLMLSPEKACSFI